MKRTAGGGGGGGLFGLRAMGCSDGQVSVPVLAPSTVQVPLPRMKLGGFEPLTPITVWMLSKPAPIPVAVFAGVVGPLVCTRMPGLLGSIVEELNDQFKRSVFDQLPPVL